MARISTYTNDTSINDNDRLIGTDGGTGDAGSGGRTRNFTVQALREYINSRGSGGSGSAAEFDTNIITSINNDGEALQLFTAHALYNPSSTQAMLVLPEASTIEDGSWVRITSLNTTAGLSIYAGSVATPTNPGNRFMAGITSTGIPTVDPHLLSIAPRTAVTLEFIYIEDTITIGGVTAPVGWIINN